MCNSRQGTLARRKDDLIDLARRHADRAGEGILADAHRSQKLLQEHFTGMDVG
jgi:hypothetical protein